MTATTSTTTFSGAQSVAVYDDLIHSERKRLIESYERISDWATKLAFITNAEAERLKLESRPGG